jgi:hypothetical protein
MEPEVSDWPRRRSTNSCGETPVEFGVSVYRKSTCDLVLGKFAAKRRRTSKTGLGLICGEPVRGPAFTDAYRIPFDKRYSTVSPFDACAPSVAAENLS